MRNIILIKEQFKGPEISIVDLHCFYLIDNCCRRKHTNLALGCLCLVQKTSLLSYVNEGGY